MNITITIPTLIDLAKRESGMKLGELAKEMHVHQARVSEWIAGKGEPTADQIAYLADKAEIPILQALAQLRPQWARVWEKAESQTSAAL
jgi:transcriptional regulator with XRE-family HTH domain